MTLEMGKTAEYLATQTPSCIAFITLPPARQASKTYSGDENKEGLIDQILLSKETEAEVDEDEILRELGEGGKHVLGGTLGSTRHVVVGIVLEGDTAKQEGDDACEPNLIEHGLAGQFEKPLTTHGQTIGKEVRGVGDEGDETGFNGMKVGQTGMFQHERATQTKDDAEGHRGQKGQQEDADAVKEGEDVNLFAVELGEGFEHDDGHSVVENGFTKDDGVEFRVDFKGVEDG